MGWVEFPVLGAFLAGERMERRLAAVLAADVAGYSRLMGLDEEGTLTRLKAVRKALVDPTIAAHRGRIVKTTGDGMLVEFASAVDAVRCAIEVQHGMAGQSADGLPHTRIELRIGIHVGDIIFDDNDIFGDGVNIAARLEGIAEPGGVCISDDTYRQIRDRVDAAFDDKGETALKNIARPVRVFALAGAQQPATKVTEPVPPLALPDKPSIAVLPFQNMSGDPEQEYFADGMVEDIITELCRIRWLFVIARNSTFTYKGQAVDVKRVARQLGVRYVLEGSVRKGGNRVRITAQLIDAISGTHIWAEAYQRGLWHFNKYGPEENQTAQTFFRRAIALDPNFAPGHYGYALALQWEIWHFSTRPFSEVQGIPLEEARIAVSLDDKDATAHAVLAHMRMWGAEWEAAIAEARTALVLNPNSSFVISMLGCVLGFGGYREEALDRLRQAMRASPNDPLTWLWLFWTGVILFFSRKFDAAVETLHQVVRLRPGATQAQVLIAASLAHLGRLDEARDHLSRAHFLDPRYQQMPWMRPEDNALRVEGVRLAAGEMK
jgi:adenylate cyclase